MDNNDFAHLWNTHTSGGCDWELQIKRNRFQPLDNRDPVTTEHKHLYWMGDNYTTIMIARAWLLSLGKQCSVAFDIACCEYIIATDYHWEDYDAGSEARQHRT